MQPVIEKELLHYEILSALEEAGMLAGLVFQGGTCLRLCYGAHRYSEDIPAQKISLEVAAIPAYTERPRMLQLNYEGLMQSYADTILNTESLEEIMADKLESYICSAYIRYRDLWDIRTILKENIAELYSRY